MACFNSPDAIVANTSTRLVWKTRQANIGSTLYRYKSSPRGISVRRLSGHTVGVVSNSPVGSTSLKQPTNQKHDSCVTKGNMQHLNTLESVFVCNMYVDTFTTKTTEPNNVITVRSSLSLATSSIMG